MKYRQPSIFPRLITIFGVLFVVGPCVVLLTLTGVAMVLCDTMGIESPVRSSIERVSSDTPNPPETRETANTASKSAQNERSNVMNREMAWLYAQLLIVESGKLPGAKSDRFPFRPDSIEELPDGQYKIVASLITPRGDKYSPFRCVVEPIPVEKQTGDDDFRLVSLDMLKG